MTRLWPILGAAMVLILLVAAPQLGLFAIAVVVLAMFGALAFAAINRWG